MKPITARQEQCLEIIERALGERGYAPTYREIADALGVKSVTTVLGLVTQLKLKGYLVSVSGKQRALVLTNPPPPPKVTPSKPTRADKDLAYADLANVRHVCRLYGFTGEDCEMYDWLENRLSLLRGLER